MDVERDASLAKRPVDANMRRPIGAAAASDEADRPPGEKAHDRTKILVVLHREVMRHEYLAFTPPRGAWHADSRAARLDADHAATVARKQLKREVFGRIRIGRFAFRDQQDLIGRVQRYVGPAGYPLVGDADDK